MEPTLLVLYSEGRLLALLVTSTGTISAWMEPTLVVLYSKGWPLVLLVANTLVRY